VYGIACELNVLELHISSGCWPHSDSCISITCSSLLWNMMHTYPFLLKRNAHRGVRYQVNRDIGKVQSSKSRSRGLTRDGSEFPKHRSELARKGDTDSRGAKGILLRIKPPVQGLPRTNKNSDLKGLSKPDTPANRSVDR